MNFKQCHSNDKQTNVINSTNNICCNIIISQLEDLYSSLDMYLWTIINSEKIRLDLI